MVIQTYIAIISFIIWVWFSVLAKANEKCDTIEFKGVTKFKSFHSNFTKQSFDFNERPLYYSLNMEIIWWNSEKNSWLGRELFEEGERFIDLFQIKKNYSYLGFSREENRTLLWNGDENNIKSRCLNYNSDCLGVSNDSIEIKYNETYHVPIDVTSKGQCIFPFKHDGEMYDYCTAKDADDFWCATKVSKSFEWKEWGFCTESCPFKRTTGKYWLTILIIAISVAFLISSIIAIAYCHLRRKKKNTEHLENNGEKDFDVFISYSNHDKDFVENILVPKLEDQTNLINYKCLLPVRDFVPGIGIMDQIADAVDSSACTMIILSKHFIKSQWARHE